MKKTGLLSLNDLKFCLAGTCVRLVRGVDRKGHCHVLQVQDLPDDKWRSVKKFHTMLELYGCREAALHLAEAAGQTDEPSTAEKLLECAADINARAEAHKP